MTEHPKNITGNDVTDVTSGALGDAIVAWLEKCAAQSIQPRVTATADSVTLRAGAHATKLAVTPEAMKAALAPYKSDARWNVTGVKHAGYTDAIYRLNAATPGYVSTGKPRTNGTRQTEGNTQTVHLGSVAKAQVALDKAVAASEKATALVEEMRVKLEDARKAETVYKLEADKKAADKLAADKVKAQADRAKLEAKIAKMREEAAKLEALLAA